MTFEIHFKNQFNTSDIIRIRDSPLNESRLKLSVTICETNESAELATS